MMDEHIEILALLHLTCRDQQQMVDRIQRRALIESRLDDANLDVIKHRFETYEEETRSVIDAIPSGLVHNVNADQSPILVLKDILDSISKLNLGS
jgi:adenylate kinase